MAVSAASSGLTILGAVPISGSATYTNTQVTIGTYSGQQYLYLGSAWTSGVGLYSFLQSSSYYSSTDHTNVLALNPNGGNVGIGKTNPTCSLDVSGSVNVSSLYFNNSSFGITYSTFTITSANTWYTIFTSTGPGVYLISCCDLQFAWGGCLSVTCDSAGNGGIISFTVLSSNYMLFQKSTNELQIKSGSANRTLNISFYRLA